MKACWSLALARRGALSALANKACFSGDTPARTNGGDIPWRGVREGDYLLAGDEYNPRGTLEWKRVLGVFSDLLHNHALAKTPTAG